MLQLKNSIDKVLSKLLIGLMGIMVINVLWQVASRYLLGAPSLFTDELANFLLIWLGLLGAAYVTGQKGHMAIDIYPNKLTEEKRKRLDIIISVLIIFFASAVMIIGGSRQVYITLILEQLSPVLKVPMGYIYAVLPLSGLLIVFYAISEIKEKI